MNPPEFREVDARDEGVRVDRWLRRCCPGLPAGHVQKLLRTGQVRVDGRRVRPGERLGAGAVVRIPPVTPAPGRPMPVPDALAEKLLGRVLYRDSSVIALDKPPGLAVQGGGGTTRHLDGLLDVLRFGSAERPRLVHRLDRDTSGLLLLARTAGDAERLAAAFRGRDVEKLYWAVTAGVPDPPGGRIDLPLAKRGRPGGARVVVDRRAGKRAVSRYGTVAHAGRHAARVELWPLTGRTHQLRVHLAEIGAPVLGDAKYGGAGAFISAMGLDPMMHLHARAITLEHPRGGGRLSLEAPAPPHMMKAFSLLGLGD